MKDKVLTLESAAALVGNGEQVLMSGRIDWSPMAMLRQLIKQGRRGLRLIGCVGGDINLDIMVGAGAASSIDTCSVHLGHSARGAPNFSRHLARGRVKALDNT